MEGKEKDFMRKMHVKLVRELDTTGLLLSQLFQDNVLSEEDVEKIKAKKTSKKRAEKLLKTLKKRRRGLKMLIRALILSKMQDFLGFEILGKVTWSEEEKETFLKELHNDLDEKQKVEAELVEAKRKIQQLTLRCTEYERKLNEKEDQLRKGVSSREAHRFKLFRKFFRQSKRKQDEAVNTEDFPSLPPRNGSMCLPPPDNLGDPYEASTSSMQCSINSASGSIWESEIEIGFADSRRLRTRQSTSSAPVPREIEAESRAGSRAASLVSSASIRFRNVFESFRSNQHTRLKVSLI